MAEANETGTLPGGFESVEKMYEALETAKSDLSTHKVKAADLKALQDKLTAFETEAETRKQAQMTELEKAQARIAALEKEHAEKDAALTHATRLTLLERELSKRLSKYDERVGGIARRLYEAAAAPGFADEAELTALLDPVDSELEGIGTPSGVRVTPGAVSSPGGKPDPKAAASAREFLRLPYKEQVAAARRATKG